uniref:G_PROTEIN_RECEP_F1_2 domain-containing protein n=1 Tax=Ascaris lumbricoides TaxID=6252 RepID=A0A0M3I6Z7_ASCLU
MLDNYGDSDNDEVILELITETLNDMTTAIDSATTTMPVADSELSWSSIILAIIMGALSVVTVVGNLAVLFSYYIDKNIRQPSNYFIFSLAVSDLRRELGEGEEADYIGDCLKISASDEGHIIEDKENLTDETYY